MTQAPQTEPESVDVAIIGAGFGGLGLGARLRQTNRDDFIIFDAAKGVGGTWWTNRYPGCACDVPSHLYSLSFFPNPDWSRRFAPRAEIQAYLERLVDHFDLAPRLRLGTRITRAEWDTNANCWHLEDDRGRRWRASVVVSAIGGLSRPKMPAIPGLDRFAGQVVHSQQWDETVRWKNTRVALIGTGASAAQIVPEIAAGVRHLDVYQRTPHWILPRPDRAIGPGRRALYRRFRLARKLARFAIWALSEARVPGLVWSTRLAAGHRLLAHAHRRKQIDDRELRAALTPEYDIGCKRVILSSDYHPALERANVELVTSPIERVEADAVIDSRGVRRPAETLVLATGFKATDPVPRGLITGRDGRDLAERWAGGPEAWRGVMVSGFPNLFLLMGPNTALGHNSVILMLEAQANFILRALDHRDRQRQPVLEIRASAQRDYNDWLHRKLARTVWNSGGCSSWYLHPDSGRNTTLWPASTWRYMRMMKRLNPGDFIQSPSR